MKVIEYAGPEPKIVKQGNIDPAVVLRVLEKQLDVLRLISQSVVLIERGTKITLHEPDKRPPPTVEDALRTFGAAPRPKGQAE